EVLNGDRLENKLTKSIQLPDAAVEGEPVLGIKFVPVVYEVNYPQSIAAGFSHTYNAFFYQVKAIAEFFSLSVERGDASIIGDQVGSVVSVGVILDDFVSAGQF